LFDLETSSRITRGSSPQGELRQGFFDWMKRLRSIEEPQFNRSSPGPITESNIQGLSAVAPDTSPAADSNDDQRWQDDGGEGS